MGLERQDLYQAALILKAILTVAVIATAAAISVIVNDAIAPRIEQAFERIGWMEQSR